MIRFVGKVIHIELPPFSLRIKVKRGCLKSRNYTTFGTPLIFTYVEMMHFLLIRFRAGKESAKSGIINKLNARINGRRPIAKRLDSLISLHLLHLE